MVKVTRPIGSGLPPLEIGSEIEVPEYENEVTLHPGITVTQQGLLRTEFGSYAKTSVDLTKVVDLTCNINNSDRYEHNPFPFFLQDVCALNVYGSIHAILDNDEATELKLFGYHLSSEFAKENVINANRRRFSFEREAFKAATEQLHSKIERAWNTLKSHNKLKQEDFSDTVEFPAEDYTFTLER